jgi:pyruvate carboxylase
VKKFQESPTKRDLLSYCLYPKVMEDFFKSRQVYGDLTRMDSHVFFMGMARGETTTMNIQDGKLLVIKFVGLGDMNDDGTRQVIFELNGSRREIAVRDKTAVAVASNVVMADPDDPMQVGSSIPGMVSKILVKPGDEVVENQVLAIIEAMKMETSVVARCNGLIDKVHVAASQSVKAGELLMTLK